MPFTLPNDGEVFIEQVLERCKNLISSGIWEGLTQIRLDTWMKNFASATERYFGACVLDCLIYRSEKQTISLMEQLFQRTLPDLLRRHPAPGGSGVPWVNLLRLRPFEPHPPVCVVPVIKWGDPPTKSGPALARLYRRHLHLTERWMIWPWQIEAAKKVGFSQFLFVDDFLGTGEQFCGFAEQFGLLTSLQGCYAVYAPLVAHKEGISTVQSCLPDLHVVTVEAIDNSYSLFSDESPWFDDGLNSARLARDFYDALVARLELPIKPDALRGFGKLSLAYAFSHATPDNCLPIIWSEGNGWKPLLER
jgi:hypothetical protein